MCSISTIIGTNGLNNADVPLSNKQTNTNFNIVWRNSDSCAVVSRAVLFETWDAELQEGSGIARAWGTCLKGLEMHHSPGEVVWDGGEGVCLKTVLFFKLYGFFLICVFS